MNKGQRGNKEAKKPRKVRPPDQPIAGRVPDSVAPMVASLPPPRKR